MNVTLGVFGRIVIMSQVLPDSGSIDEAIACQEIRSKLRITDEEQKDLQITSNDEGGLEWDASAEDPQEFEFTEQQVETIQKGFQLLSAKGEMPTGERHIRLYRAFQNGNDDTE